MPLLPQGREGVSKVAKEEGVLAINFPVNTMKA